MGGGPAKAESIDEYIAGFSPEVQAILERIRSTVRKAAPGAQETIGYAIPAFRLRGALVYFASTATATVEGPSAEVPVGGAAAPSATLDAWLGQWNGPEGTFLVVARTDGRYAVTIQNLDGPSTYEAIGVEDHIEFQRNGETESIRATDGTATGMKWLQDKQHCLTIDPGEGYCRD